jgi:hypothetical protein
MMAQRYGEDQKASSNKPPQIDGNALSLIAAGHYLHVTKDSAFISKFHEQIRSIAGGILKNLNEFKHGSLVFGVNGNIEFSPYEKGFEIYTNACACKALAEAGEVASVEISTSDWFPAPFAAAVVSPKVNAVFAAVVSAQFQTIALSPLPIVAVVFAAATLLSGTVKDDDAIFSTTPVEVLRVRTSYPPADAEGEVARVSIPVLPIRSFSLTAVPPLCVRKIKSPLSEPAVFPRLVI